MKKITSVLASLVLGMAFSCTDKGQPETEPNDLTLPETTLATVLVSKAGQSSYWKSKNVSMSARASESVSYPFATIVIKNVSRYAADNKFDAAPFNGISELFVTEFLTLDANGTELVSDVLLTVKHDAGEYSCILNSGKSDADMEESVFSSHKQLTDNAIEKNFSFPHYNLFINNKVKSKTFYFGIVVSLSEQDISFDAEPNIWLPLQSPDIVQTNDVYAVNELVNNN